MRYLLCCVVLAACVSDRRDAAPAEQAIPIDTGRVPVAGSTLFYEVSGSGDPVVLMHGGNLDRRMWDAEFDSLRRSHRVIRFDARGFGRSGPPDTAFQAHEDLRVLLDSLAVDSAALVGLSLGGRIAMDFALAHPGRVTRLVLAGPGISGGTWAPDGDSAWLPKAREALAAKDSVALARAWLESAYIRTAFRDTTGADRIRQVAIDQAPFWGAMIRHGDKEVEANAPAAGRLKELSMPILLIVGGDDTPFIQDVANAIARDAPNVRRVDIPNVGHMINLEAPARFLSEIRAFLPH
jgi:pimeloyl-ACP methyl ester carboxylesterase